LVKKIIFISNINTDFQTWKWASFTRNYWINNAKNEFIYFFDDDNIFNEDFLEKTIDIYNKRNHEFKKDFLLSPVIIYRETNIIQNAWFINFNYWLSKPIKNINKSMQVKMIWANSFFWKTEFLKKNTFDEKIPFVYEDLDWSYNITKKWDKIFVDQDLKINHMDRDKHFLEHAYMGDSNSSYLKAKNRILFIKKNWNSIEIFQALFVWIRIQNIWLTLKILIYWKTLNRYEIIKKLWQWTIKWLTTKIK
jgi:hypothetical protein